MKRVKGPYIKFVYWLTGEDARVFKEEMERTGASVKAVRGVVCSPLDPLNRISLVEPSVWNATCRRQGSWYRSSDKDGLYLAVSSSPLEGWKDRMEFTIQESDFVRPSLATNEEKQALLNNPNILGRIPEEWKQAAEVEKRTYLRWAKMFGSDVADFDSLHVSHTANHANFIEPRFFVHDEDGVIPYSIDRTAHLCSCCLELFGILGSAFKKRLVAPCPGAVTYARLKQDQYLLVEDAQKITGGSHV